MDFRRQYAIFLILLVSVSQFSLGREVPSHTKRILATYPEEVKEAQQRVAHHRSKSKYNVF